MKAYGIPRTFCAAFPDPVDGVLYALKSSRLRPPGPGGDRKSSVRNSRKKRAIRRFWKKRARARLKRISLDD